MSYLYRVYGLNIESEIKIPELSKLDNDSNIDAKINYEISLMENTTHASAGKEEIKPISETEYKSSKEDTIFSLIREEERNRWKNSESQTQQKNVLDY